MRKATLGAFGVCLWAAAASSATPDPLESKVTHIRDRFVAAVRACGANPGFEPAIRVATEPSVISYDGNSRTLVIGRWKALPPPIQQFMNEWAIHDMPAEKGEGLFDTLFNGFLVGHELGHWVEDQSGRLETLGHYDAEIEADEIAIAFASIDGGEHEARIRVGQFSYLDTLPNPLPAGEDARRYFDANYWSLARSNPLAYNWYQGGFMRQAWARHREGDFCTLVMRGAAR